MTLRAATLVLALLAGGGALGFTKAPSKSPGTVPKAIPGGMPRKPSGQVVRPPGSVPAPTDPWLVDPYGLWWFRSPVNVPAIVFVSRRPLPGDAVIPGLGPLGRTATAGGRLMIRTSAGAVHPLMRDDPFEDVADPAVSWDGKQIAFAAITHRDSAWRLWVVGPDGRAPRQVTRTDRAADLSPLGRAASRFRRYDDFDPVWLPDGTLCFASTRYPQIAGEGEVLASNLFAVRADGTGMRRLTTDRHGAEEPAVDPRTGRIVYARWWTNRHLASERSPGGVTTDRALADEADEVDLWHAIEIDLDGDGAKLAGGFPRVRLETMAYQPVILEDGTLVGMSGDALSAVKPRSPNLGLSAGERPDAWVQAYPGGFAAPRWIPGRRFRDDAEMGPIRACAPAAISGRRLAISIQAPGREDFGIYLAEAPRPGEDRNLESPWEAPTRIVRLVDLPGTHELDAAVLAPRALPPVLGTYSPPLPHDVPSFEAADYRSPSHTFRFDCMNVFSNAPVDAPIPDAPPIDTSLAIRFYAAIPRPGTPGADSAILLRQALVYRSGGVHEEGMPSDAPMFEQLVSAHGRTVRNVQGPAHVAGFNVARFGSGTKCMGCHVGHSAIAVARDYETAKRLNVSPSARVSASSAAPATAGARAAVDRRAKGPVHQVAWVADAADSQWIRFDWPVPVEVDSVILYALSAHPSQGTDVRVREVELAFSERGRPSGKLLVRAELSPMGTPIACNAVRADAMVVRPVRVSGRVLGRPRVAIAEIETRARIADR